MNCEECGALLLEADVAELRPSAAGPLADHLRTCVDCRRRAERIVAGHDRLAQALSAVESRGADVRRRRTWVRSASAVLLPVAAVLAALFLAPPEDRATDPELAARIHAALHPPRPLIEPPAGMRAAVVRTDQRVTLVLLYPGDR